MDMNRKLAHLHTPIGINTIKTITQRQYKTHTTTPTHMYAQQKKLIVYRYTNNKKTQLNTGNTRLKHTSKLIHMYVTPNGKLGFSEKHTFSQTIATPAVGFSFRLVKLARHK